MHYMYAVSIVSKANNVINNNLFNGLSDRNTMIGHIRSTASFHDQTFNNSIVMINCNIAEHQGSGQEFQFSRSYGAGILAHCLEEIIGDIEQAL